MAKAKRRAKPRRTSSAGRPAGGKVGAGRGKTPARSGATAAGKATAGKAGVPSKRRTGAVGKATSVTKVTTGGKTRAPVVGSRPKVSAGRKAPEAKAASATAAKMPVPASAAKVAPKPSSPRKPEIRAASPLEAAPDANRSMSEGAAREKTSETTAQGFAPAAPAAGGEAQQNGGSSAGLPVPIASFTI